MKDCLHGPTCCKRIYESFPKDMYRNKYIRYVLDNRGDIGTFVYTYINFEMNGSII